MTEEVGMFKSKCNPEDVSLQNSEVGFGKPAGERDNKHLAWAPAVPQL